MVAEVSVSARSIPRNRSPAAMVGTRRSGAGWKLSAAWKIYED